MRERFVDAGGLPMRWLEREDGAPAGGAVPVVLVHGIPTSPQLWRHVVAQVDGVRLLAWEMVGYGRSWQAGEQADISLAAQAGHLLRWLDAMEIERAVLVGHDLGGGVVQIAATRAPERCAGLVITNGVSYDAWPVAPVKALRAVGGVIERLPRPLLRAQLWPFYLLTHDDQGMARESGRLHMAAGYDHPRGGAAFVRQMRSLDSRDTEAVAPALPGLDVPAAVVWGAGDRFLRVGYGRRLAADLRAPIDEIDGANHFTPEDHPDRIAAAIRSVASAA